MTYKRRWVLCLEQIWLPMGKSVATCAPMKRGLKDDGREFGIRHTAVATCAPTKRGLKVFSKAPWGCNNGTKSARWLLPTRGHSLFPPYLPYLPIRLIKYNTDNHAATLSTHHCPPLKNTLKKYNKDNHAATQPAITHQPNFFFSGFLLVALLRLSAPIKRLATMI